MQDEDKDGEAGTPAVLGWTSFGPAGEAVGCAGPVMVVSGRPVIYCCYINLSHIFLIEF
jgi:hypothetical protein